VMKDPHSGMMPATSPDALSSAPGATAHATSASSGSTQFGPDVASYQHPNNAAIDWSAVARSGQTFAIVKATERGGSGLYTNPWLGQDLAGARAAGLNATAYAFARPQFDAITQADDLVNAMGPSPAGSLPPVLDLEDNGGLTPVQLVAWTHAFLDRVESDTGILGMIYSGPYFWRDSTGNSTAFNRYPLWEASYQGRGCSGAPQAMGGWTTFDLWQFTNAATIPGIQGNVDQSCFLGQRSNLNLLAQHAYPSAWAAPDSESTGRRLMSPNRQYTALVQDAGGLVVSGNGQQLWSAGSTTAGATLYVQSDGNVVLYGPQHQPLWSSRTHGTQVQLVLDNTGSLRVVASEVTLWTSGSKGTAVLVAPASLSPGQFLHSASGRVQAIMQSDGNFVVYNGHTPVWSSQTQRHPQSQLVAQSDGNVVVYDKAHHPLWSTGTAHSSGCRLVMQDDTNLVLYCRGGVRWHSR
jgi:lysozyme